MISTKYVSIDHIPSSWVFEYYCELNQKLCGQELKIKSLINRNERTPSFWIYPKNGRYRFWDFSSGYKGTALTLVMLLFNLDEKEAIKKICIDYEKEGLNPVELEELKEEPKYRIKEYNIRAWNKTDAEFWVQFNIGSSLLEKFNVRPLESFVMAKEGLQFTLKKRMAYGFFKKDGTLYKIYEPFAYNKSYKFLTFDPYLQGSEQLTYNPDTLVLCSSLKDVMSLISLNLNVEAVAPSSENTIISKGIITSYRVKYNRIFTLFDNDQAGHNAMRRYESLYGIPGIYLNLSKDLSDSIRDFNTKKVKQILEITL